ncbi:hypothetical protein DXD79_00680 [Hungatella hathewayi]|uniref:Uncharacterized protein n=1 Tax=Hungatella hathewayi TaxID=154046 RepID=A0A374PD69_9FIRM|nr:hypothetical protein DXD79_00680 [Hungatella hathewayi]RGL00079.1 hypothetical protein DXC88_03155 [Hungatella hathewayi]RHC47572.1 hypothetical protein DW841_19780 [Hungatella hathewayi]
MVLQEMEILVPLPIQIHTRLHLVSIWVLRGQKIHWELRLCVMEKMYFVMLTVLLVHILTWKVEQQNFMSAK